VTKIVVQAGDEIVAGQKLVVLEAMKMEATICAEANGKVAQIHVVAGTQVETGDLLVTMA
jgi:biotin carboxyl carrier protein